MDILTKNGLFTFIVASAIFIALFFLEKISPLRTPTQNLIPRLTVNLSMSFLTFFVALILVRPVTISTLNWTSNASFGVLNLFQSPTWAKTIVGFLLLDLTFYYWHMLNHRFPFLWRFHNTHHIDPDLDVSTAFRFHFGEVALSSIFRAIQVLIIGPSLFIFLTYELVFQIATFFHHSNLGLPKKWDQSLKLIIVTPRMHGIHHSNYQSETNSNYSVIFSFWDRLHRTFVKNVSQSEVKVGVPGYSLPEDNHLLSLIKAPFQPQKDYWLGRKTRNPRP